MQRISKPAAGAIVFFATLAFVYWASAQRFVMSNDEGIFLEGATRILQGETPYRDFFLLMGPASFWFQAIALKLFGATLMASRVFTMLDLAVVATCMYWLIAERSNRALAAFTAGAFIVMEIADPVVALPNHRWDSAALALLAVTVIATTNRRVFLFAAGVCAALAAWATPSVTLVGLMLAAYLTVQNRRLPWSFLAGCTALSACAAGWLAYTGALVPMFEHLFWTAANYSGPNYMPYGSIVGGYKRFYYGASGTDLAARLLVTAGIVLPAIIPPIAVALLAWRRKLTSWPLLLVAAGTMILTTYPRMDVPHLAYVAPISYVLLALALSTIKRPKVRMAVFMPTCLVLSVFLLYAVVLRYEKRETGTDHIGTIRASSHDAALIHALEKQIPPGSDLFVYPYLPVLYFITQTHNPTRYSYLQPGLMTDEDETTAMQELIAAPQAKVLYYNFTEAELLRIWPATDAKRLRMHRLEPYIQKNYRTIATFKYQQGEFFLMERKPEAVASAPSR